MEKPILLEKFKGEKIVSSSYKNGFTRIYNGRYLCFCGKEFIGPVAQIKRGWIKSCGCLHPYIDGRSKTRLYDIYKKIISRCYDQNNKDYLEYGGRNISVDPSWHDFLIFKKWAEENGYQEYLTIDRIENDKGYSPDNCRWSTKRVQCINRRKFKKSVSRFHGVVRDDKAWTARLGNNGTRHYLGAYQTEIAAALAYNIASKKYHGEFAKFNNIDIDLEITDEFLNTAQKIVTKLLLKMTPKDAATILVQLFQF